MMGSPLRLRPVLFAALLAVAAAVPGRAQAPADSPEAVAEQILSVTRAGDWRGVANLMHPEALVSIRSLFGPVAEAPAGAEIRTQMFRVGSVEEAKGLSDEEFFARFLGFTMTQQPGMLEAMKSAEMSVVGTVPEGADVVHVLARIRMTMNGVSMTQLDVTSLKRHEGRWRGMLKGDLSAFATAMRQALSPN